MLSVNDNLQFNCYIRGPQTVVTGEV